MKRLVSTSTVAGELQTHKSTLPRRLYPGDRVAPRQTHKRNATSLRVVIASLVFITVSTVVAKMALDAARDYESVTAATTYKVVDGIHIALPNTLRYVPIEQVVAWP
jgi:hypothetical protein